MIRVWRREGKRQIGMLEVGNDMAQQRNGWS